VHRYHPHSSLFWLRCAMVPPSFQLVLIEVCNGTTLIPACFDWGVQRYHRLRRATVPPSLPAWNMIFMMI
jgi:hypothetical protein